jgi:hypothetical protein
MTKKIRDMLLALIILMIGTKLLFSAGFSFISKYDTSLINFSEIQKMENSILIVLGIITFFLFIAYLAKRGENKNALPYRSGPVGRK